MAHINREQYERRMANLKVELMLATVAVCIAALIASTICMGVYESFKENPVRTLQMAGILAGVGVVWASAYLVMRHRLKMQYAKSIMLDDAEINNVQHAPEEGEVRTQLYTNGGWRTLNTMGGFK